MRAPALLAAASAAGCAGAKVGIIGAGVSGLSTAYQLITQHGMKGSDIVIVERERMVGGRTINTDVPGHPGVIAELGGTWVGPTQDEVVKLVDELGLQKFVTYTKNFKALDNDTSKNIRYFDQWASEVPLDAPWDYPHAAELDAVTVKEWEKRNGTKVPDDAFGSGLANPQKADVSMLFMLWWIRSCQTIERDESLLNGAQKWRIAGGSQMISLTMADKVTAQGAALHLNTTVSKVEYGAAGATIHAADGRSFAVDKVVVAMGSVDRPRIAFDPPLPEAHAEWMKLWTKATTVKSFLYWDEGPFWRKSALISPSIGLDPDLQFFDYSPPGDSPDVGIWMYFSCDGYPDPCDESEKGRNSRRNIMLDGLKTAPGSGVGLGSPKPAGYFEHIWNEDKGFSNCVGGAGPGALTKYGKGWYTPVSNQIFWAGSDSSGAPTDSGTTWTGYMDGGVRSGQRVAAEVAAALR